MKNLQGLNKLCSLFKALGCNSKAIIDISFKEIWVGLTKLLKEKMFKVSHEETSIGGSHLGSHGHPMNLGVRMVIKGKCDEGEEQLSQSKEGGCRGFENWTFIEKIGKGFEAICVGNAGIQGYNIHSKKVGRNERRVAVEIFY